MTTEKQAALTLNQILTFIIIIIINIIIINIAIILKQTFQTANYSKNISATENSVNLKKPVDQLD